MLSLSDVFALQDSELGETDLVTHTIDTGSAKLVQTSPRQLPYVLRQELEQELARLLHTGCIEPSNNPYSSACKKEEWCPSCMCRLQRSK